MPGDDLESRHVADIHDAELYRAAADQFEMTAVGNLGPTQEGEEG